MVKVFPPVGSTVPTVNQILVTVVTLKVTIAVTQRIEIG